MRKKKEDTSHFAKAGKSLEDSKISFVEEVLSSFKLKLAEFATKHRDRINSDPEFRQQFHAMCISAGVDPLASNKGFWADILGVGEFYFELAVKIIQICVSTRTSNGGLMSCRELLLKLRNTKSVGQGHELSMDDIYKAVEKLHVLGSGFRIIRMSGVPMILSVPLEINTDHEQMIETAQSCQSYVTSDMMTALCGWTLERFSFVINSLLLEGMVWIDDYNGERRYYFPSLWKAM